MVVEEVVNSALETRRHRDSEGGARWLDCGLVFWEQRDDTVSVIGEKEGDRRHLGSGLKIEMGGNLVVGFKPDQGIGLANAATSGKSVIASVSIRLARLHRLPSEAGHVCLRINLCFWVASVRTRPGLCLFRPYRWHRCGLGSTLIIFFSRYIHHPQLAPLLFPFALIPRSPYR